VDLVHVARIERARQRFGDRFLQRVFAAEELRRAGGDSRRLAGRWAAKEAVMKALPAQAAGTRLRDIVVETAGSGAPSVRVPAPWDAGWQVSISHERDTAVAVAIWSPPAVVPPWGEWLERPEDLAAVAASLPARPPNAQKRDFGPITIVAGSVGYTGAAFLCATAAARAGAGLVELLVAPGIYPILAAQCHEVIVRPLAGSSSSVGEQDAPALAEALDRSAAGVVGPGLGREPGTWSTVLRLVREVTTPLVVDADALNAWAQAGAGALRAAGPRVLTPHPGEAARLLGCSTADVQADRPAAATRLQELTGQVIVLKGAGTLVAAGGDRLWQCSFGSALLASGGTGDVLAGTIGGLMAQGAAPAAAARAGVLAHCGAAWSLSERLGDSGLLASDLLEPVAEALAGLRRLPL
jgi:NAD(P)H-hydrate epimerase